MEKIQRERIKLYQRPDSSFWCYDYRDSFGKRYRGATGESDRIQAIDKAVRLLAISLAKSGQTAEQKKIKTGGTLQKYPSMPLKDAFTVAFEDDWAKHKSYADKRKNADDIIELLGAETPLCSIDVMMLNRAVARLKCKDYKPATVNRKIAEIRALLNRANKHWGILPHSFSYPNLPENNQREYYYTKEDEVRIMTAARKIDPLFEDYLQVLLYTGMRRNEAMTLRAKDIDFERNIILLPEHKTRSSTGRARVVFMSTHVSTILKRLTAKGKDPFEAYSTTMVRRRWDKVQAELKLTPEQQREWVLHAFRHTCASRLVQDGASLKLVADWMGHSSIKTTERYSHLSAEHLKGLAAIMDASAASAV